MVTYCSADDVARILQTVPFGVSTTPTQTQVENIILRKEDRIDNKLNHSWREVTVTDSFIDLTSVETANGARFDLPNYTIKNLATGSGDKLEVWDGSAYVDFLVSKTEGRNSDFWVDYKLGIVYIRNNVILNNKKPIRITYRFGETVIPGDIQDLCIFMTAKDILSMYQRNIRFGDDGGSAAITSDQRITVFDKEIKSLFASNSNIGTF